MNKFIRLSNIMFFVSTLVFSIGFASVYVFLQKQHLKQEKMKTLTISGKNLANNIGIPVKVGDLVTTYQQAKMFQDILPDIHLKIFSNTGEVLFESDFPKDLQSSKVEIPVSYSDSVVGIIQLHFKPTPLSFSTNDWFFVFVNIMVIASLFGLISWILQKQSRGLKTLIDSLYSLGYENQPKEIGGLADLEPDLRQIGQEINMLLYSKSEAIKKVEELKTQKVISDLVRQTCHDIRSPITALNVLISDRVEIDPNYKSMIVSIVDRIEEIADGLLARSKDENIKISININQLIESCLKEKKLENRGESIFFEFITDQSNTNILIEESKFRRVFSNLLNNAIDANLKKGQITITAKSTNTHLAITIEDEGPGIPEELLKKIESKEYFTNKSHGNGLGIKSAWEYVEEFGGDFNVKSRPGAGAKVSLLLPLS